MPLSPSPSPAGPSPTGASSITALSTRDFAYELPAERIAQQPLTVRSASRLLVWDPVAHHTEHRRFAELPNLLTAEDLLVVNDTQVMRARFFAVKDSGGRAEVLVERIESDRVALCHVRVSKALKPGRTLAADAMLVTVLQRCGELYRLEFPSNVGEFLDRFGEVPLPPYIARGAEPTDVERYQTVYAQQLGAVAAPTAGLHFDDTVFTELDTRGVPRVSLTLHVGAGTFQPVRVHDATKHRMHTERVTVDKRVVDAVAACRVRGGRVVAVGTTVVRALETAARGGELVPFDGETDIFIYPGFQFRTVDALLTNFHLPESTLLMLVAAFTSREGVLAVYREAIALGYRFFSYGDAMFITRQGQR
jgi:S-adenosylmethionine:tRNA ribosyltransferase-isomerase